MRDAVGDAAAFNSPPRARGILATLPALED
jgi:hypothetical protein